MAKRVGKTDDQPFVKLFRELTYRWTPWEVWQDSVGGLAGLRYDVRLRYLERGRQVPL